MKIDTQSRNIPSLDGLRAISILLVIIGHSNQAFARWIKVPAGVYLFWAHTGVMVFFVISGFLITSLLLKELQATGNISLRRFYLRRAFRIFPPFYFYLILILALALAGVFHTPIRAFFFSATYTSNYYLGRGGDFVGLQHTWSLSIEEQFYLLWPAALLGLGRLRASYLAIILIIISPFSRLATYFALAPAHRAMVDRMFHSSLDTLMFGCLLAILSKEDRFRKPIRRWADSRLGFWGAAASGIFLTVLDPFLSSRFRGEYDLLAGMTLEGIAICLVMLYVVERPRTLPGRVLNTPVLRHIGVISYSLYLWQNILIGEGGRYFPLDLLALLACAELSYWVIERPSLRLRDRVQKSLTGRKTKHPAVPSA